MERPVIERGGATTRGPIIAGFAGYSGGGWTMRRDSRDERRGRPVAEDSLDAQARRDAEARERLARYVARFGKGGLGYVVRDTRTQLQREIQRALARGLTPKQAAEAVGCSHGLAKKVASLWGPE